jgi:hypothetical protein
MKLTANTIFFKKHFLFTVFSLSLLIFGCNKIDQQKYISYKSYLQLQPGKFLIYELDSIVTRPFGTSFETRSYIIKDSVIDIIYDNLNRPSLRVFRYIKDANNGWVNNNTFIITATDNGLEYLENNLRYIKMANPVSAYTNWNGNSYIDKDASPFPFDPNFLQWQYSYTNINTPKTFNGTLYPNTITVVQYDSTQDNIFYSNGYSIYSNGYEVYADSVGMVYKEIMDWEYQVLTSVSGCKHVFRNSANKLDTVAIDCQDGANNCDSIANVQGNQIIDCDTSIINSSYNGYGIRQVLLEHN